MPPRKPDAHGTGIAGPLDEKGIVTSARARRRGRLRTLLRACGLALTMGLTAIPAASASAATRCGNVSYTIPNTNDEGHAALNNVAAVNVSCRTARSVARTFLVTGKAPRGWHASTKNVITHVNGQANTVTEEILARRTARVTGDIAN
jgi:hypothetical protein